MRDIGDRMGLSVATVSLALAGNPRIPAATRKSVREMARSMGYLPDPAVAALSRRRRLSREASAVNVAFLAAPSVAADLEKGKARPLLQNLHHALRSACRRDGFGFETLGCPETPAEMERFRRLARNRNLRGLLVAHPFHLPDTLCLPPELPTLSLLARHRDISDRPLVTSNYRQSLIETMNRLREAGYRKPGLFLVSRTFMYESPRQAPADQGIWRYLSVFDAFGAATFPNAKTLPKLLCEDFDRTQFLRWLRQHQPDVIISTCDGDIPPLLKEIQPRTAYCSIDLRDPASSALSGLDQRREVIAEIAAKFLSFQIFAIDSPMVHVGLTLEVPARWVEGRGFAT